MSSLRTLLVGLGSPHGDDRIGWLLAGRVEAAVAEAGLTESCRVRLAASPVDLLDWSDGFERLIICDACQGLPRPGQMRCWSWPAVELRAIRWSGTHDLPLPTVLGIGQRLRKLPAQVMLCCVEADAAQACGVSDAAQAGIDRAAKFLLRLLI